METPIDPIRLKRLREQKGLTQAELASKAKLSKQSIYRLEKGQQPGGRKTTIEALCKALGVEEDVLTGKDPMAEESSRKAEPASDDKYQLNVRVAGDVRNAFTLTALRYRIPISRIVELAPLLFTLAAEQCLERRRKMISDFRSLHEAFEERGNQVRRAWPNVFWAFHIDIGDDMTFLAEAIEQEEEAIASNNIFEQTVFSKYDLDDSSQSNDGPFTEYLQGVAATCLPTAEIYEFFGDIGYRICQDVADKISKSDERISHHILEGNLLIHEIPKDLLSAKKSKELIDWLNGRVEEILAKWPKPLSDGATGESLEMVAKSEDGSDE